MKKNIIIYASKHHNNTYKLVKAISEKYEITTIDATKEAFADLTEYDTIGFASGIDFGKFYVEIENFAEANLPIKKEVFFLYTCAMERKGFTNSIREIALKKDAIILLKVFSGDCNVSTLILHFGQCHSKKMKCIFSLLKHKMLVF